jgi:hypothetical protein
MAPLALSRVLTTLTYIDTPRMIGPHIPPHRVCNEPLTTMQLAGLTTRRSTGRLPH